MNLLPKKSWHVQNVDNKEKVLKDEQTYGIIQEKADYKKNIDNRSQIMDRLKSKSQRDLSQDEVHYENQKDMLLKHKTHIEKEVERRAKVEHQFDLRVGGSHSLTSKKNIPWYSSTPKSFEEVASQEHVKNSTLVKEDPLSIIHQYTKTRKPFQ